MLTNGARIFSTDIREYYAKDILDDFGEFQEYRLFQRQFSPHFMCRQNQGNNSRQFKREIKPENIYIIQEETCRHKRPNKRDHYVVEAIFKVQQ